MKDVKTGQPREDGVEKVNNDELLNNESKEEVSTNSIQSSDGKGSGGYSADYSLSEEDLSSDDTGSKRKPSDAAITSVSGLRKADRKAEDERGDNEVNTSSDSLSSLEITKKHRSSRQRKRALGYTTKEGTDALLESENTFGNFLNSLLGQGFLPQLNGVLLSNVSHPMDPRIDLSNVQYAPDADIAAHANISSASFPVLSDENYLQLMDSVRPFFRVQGVPLSEPPPLQKENEGSSSDPVSSEGFTSFFTTTNTGSSNDNTTHSAESSDSNKQRSDSKEKEKKSGILNVSDQEKTKRNIEGDAGGSSGSSQKRVRILETARSIGAHRDVANNGVLCHDPGHMERAPFMARANDSTTSSSVNSDEQRQGPVTSRIVTDISSSNRTDSAAGTSESAGNTGSASNQGSSGSGADGKGSSEEGKGSSEDNAKRGDDEAGASDETAFGNKPSGTKAKIDSSHTEKMPPPQGDELREKLIYKKRKRIEMRREYEAQQHFESSESSGYNSESLFRPGKHIQMDQVLQVSNIPRLMIQALPPFIVVHANAAYSRLTGLDAHEVVGKSVNFLLALPESATHAIDGHAHGESDHERQTPQDAQEAQREPSESAATGSGRSERQRKDSSRFESLERLIVSCGFGHIQFVNAIAVNKHQMVGCNVSFLRQFNDSLKDIQAEKDEESKSSSATSNDMLGKQLILCRTAIAPIVSSQMPAETSAQTDHDTKRRKHHYSGAADTTTSASNMPKDPPGQHRRHHQPQVITHYIIQLERVATGGVIQFSVEDSISSNSTSVEARLVGSSKAALLQQKAVVDLPRDSPIALGDDEASGSTASRHKAMIAIG